MGVRLPVRWIPPPYPRPNDLCHLLSNFPFLRLVRSHPPPPTYQHQLNPPLLKKMYLLLNGDGSSAKGPLDEDPALAEWQRLHGKKAHPARPYDEDMPIAEWRRLNGKKVGPSIAPTRLPEPAVSDEDRPLLKCRKPWVLRMHGLRTCSKWIAHSSGYLLPTVALDCRTSIYHLLRGRRYTPVATHPEWLGISELLTMH